jgi:hypothetical protein
LTNQRSLQHRYSTAITALSFVETPEFALSVAVVDTCSLAGAGNHCEGSVDDVIHDVQSINDSLLFLEARLEMSHVTTARIVNDKQ